MIGETMIKRLELIGTLDDGDKAALLAVKGEVRQVGAQEDILVEKGVPDFSVIVLSGFLQRYLTSPTGARQISTFYLPTDTPSLETLPLEVMDSTLGAVTDSRIGIVSRAEMWTLMQARPNVLKLVWRETLVQAAIVRQWLLRNSLLLAHAQLAHFFCEMMTRAEAAGLASDSACPLPLSQKDLSEALGMPAVHVNRTLKVLQASGMAELRDGVLQVKNWQALVETAEFDPHYLHLRPALVVEPPVASEQVERAD